MKQPVKTTDNGPPMVTPSIRLYSLLFVITLREEIICERNMCGRNFCGIYFCEFGPKSQKFIPQNNGVISLFGTNMEEMGNKQENKQENVLKLSFLLVSGNNLTATSLL